MRKWILIFLILPFTLSGGLLIQGDFLGPSGQLIKRDGKAYIEKKMLRDEIPEALFPLFDYVSQNESWGHIGYHGAPQDFRVYQDIIRYTIEEILNIPIREDFQFLRIPGDSDFFLENIQAFFDYWGFCVNNKTEKRAKQLLSLNYGIYSNYDARGSSSMRIFAEGIANNPINFPKLLRPFYKELGISPIVLNDLFKIAHKYLNLKSGVLLRLFENSHLTDSNHEAYNFADAQCYPCRGRGFRWGQKLISEEYHCIMSEQYVEKKAAIAPQLRILLNNKNTLNPLSPLCIQRWDLYEAVIIAAYENEMRSYIRNIKSDPLKTERYREKLLHLWR